MRHFASSKKKKKSHVYFIFAAFFHFGPASFHRLSSPEGLVADCQTGQSWYCRMAPWALLRHYIGGAESPPVSCDCCLRLLGGCLCFLGFRGCRLHLHMLSSLKVTQVCWHPHGIVRRPRKPFLNRFSVRRWPVEVPTWL